MIEIGRSWDPFERIKETVKNIRYLASLRDHTNAGFKECKFARPVSIVPLAIIGYTKSLRFNNIPGYLSAIGFPEGEEIADYNSSGSTYFPITRADLTNTGSNSKEQKIRGLADKYQSLLKRNIIKDKQFSERIGTNACAVLISEMTDNIYEHSEAHNAFIFSQYWPKNDSCGICLADNGIGFYQSLKKGGRKVKDDLDGLQKIIESQLSAKRGSRGMALKIL